MDMMLPDGTVADHTLNPAARSIGEILVESGRLAPDAAKQIAAEQAAHGLRFGEAAVRLKLLTLVDIEFALARQFEYPYLAPDSSSIHPSIVTAYRPFGTVAEQMRSLRARMVLRHIENPTTPRTIAVLSPSAGEGRSFIAANLAVVFSQMGERTLLIDADMRRPVQHQLFGMPNHLGLSNFLLGRAGFQDVRRVPGLLDLSLLSAGSLPPNPQELLTRPMMSKLMKEAASIYDVVIVDTPAASRFADAQIIAARTGSSLLVSRAKKTDGLLLKRIVTSLRESGASLAGAVMNDG